jgi:hypothetical protein
MIKGDIVYWYYPIVNNPEQWCPELMSGIFSHYEEAWSYSLKGIRATKLKKAIIRSITHPNTIFVVDAYKVSLEV